ncbi:hypothetical protein EAF04_007704 [Stromatinia cepivora]|nr:hypothetical protein EAF04_007704 [Stromatinia cepivora]
MDQRLVQILRNFLTSPRVLNSNALFSAHRGFRNKQDLSTLRDIHATNGFIPVAPKLIENEGLLKEEKPNWKRKAHQLSHYSNHLKWYNICSKGGGNVTIHGHGINSSGLEKSARRGKSDTSNPQVFIDFRWRDVLKVEAKGQV